MRDYELNGLHIIVSEDFLKQQMSVYLSELMIYTKNDTTLQRINQSVSNIRVEFDKALKAVEVFCSLCPQIITQIPQTKKGAFSRARRTLIYKLNLKSNLVNMDYFSQTGYQLQLDFGAKVTKQEYVALASKYGNDFEDSGKFLFLNFVETDNIKCKMSYLLDSKLKVQTGVVTQAKPSYLAECKVGHLYKNKDGNTYLCLPSIVTYTVCSVHNYPDGLLSHLNLERRDKYYELDFTQFFGTKEQLSALNEWDRMRVEPVFDGLIDDKLMHTKEEEPFLDKIIRTSTYNPAPVFVKYTKDVAGLVSQYSTAQEVVAKNFNNLSFLYLAKAKQMIADEGRMIASKPQRVLLYKHGTSYCCFLSGSDTFVRSTLKPNYEDYKEINWDK